MKIRYIFPLLLILLSCLSGSGQGKDFRIGILIVDGFQHNQEALSGLIDGIELSKLPHRFDIKSTHGSEAESRDALRRWKSERIDLICTIGTKPTLWALEEVQNIPIVFTAVTNPVSCGIAEDWGRPGRNATGSSNWIDAEQKLSVFKRALPHLKTLGVVYNPANPVATAEVVEARKAHGALDIALAERTIVALDEMESAIASLSDEKGIDALWVPRDSLIYEHMGDVAKMTIPRRLPVVSSTFQGLRDGRETVIIAVQANYEILGRLAFPAVYEILTKEKDPAEIPIARPSHHEVIINANAADVLEYRIPPLFLATADKVLRGFAGQEIVVPGTGESQNIMRIVAGALEEKLKGGKIRIPDSIGSGGGIKALAAGKADLARTARPLAENEKKLGLTQRIFAKCPVVFAVHPSVTGVDNLTSQQILKIYAGEITDWDEVGGRSGKIYPITREPGEACLTALKNRLPGFGSGMNTAAKIIYTTPKMVEALARHRKTIGFAALSAFSGTELRILKIDGVSPSPENVLNGAYPFALPYGIVFQGELTGLRKRFVDFLFEEEGMKILMEHGVVPFREMRAPDSTGDVLAAD